jgi:hypothetical protein
MCKKLAETFCFHRQEKWEKKFISEMSPWAGHSVSNIQFQSPIWSIGQSSRLQIQKSAFDSRRYQIFWEVVGLERGPRSLASRIEELIGRKSSGSGLENRDYGCRNPSRWPRGTLCPQTLALTSQTSSGRSVGIVRLQTQATEFSFSLVLV